MNRKFSLSGSLTVETALVLPVFVFCVMIFCYFFQLIQLQLQLQTAINKTCREVTECGYLFRYLETEDTTDKSIFDEIYNTLNLNKLIAAFTDQAVLCIVAQQHLPDSVLSDSGVIDGWSGVSFSGSSLCDKEGKTRVQITYYVRIPFFGSVISPIRMKQRTVLKNFRGYQVASKLIKQDPEPMEGGTTSIEGEITSTEEGTLVYLTEAGQVYHVDRNCRHLNVSISTSAYADLNERRNEHGAKYYPCEHCWDENNSVETVYITGDGNRYHRILSCSGLKRTIRQVPKAEASGYQQCKSCRTGAIMQT